MLPSPDPDLAAVVRPMIVQFLVLAALWVGSGGMGRIGFGPSGPGMSGEDPRRFSFEVGRVLLPLLMLTTGALFFSRPLAPLWAPLLGPLPGGMEGTAIALPAGFSLLFVLVANLAVVLFLTSVSGGLDRSPFVPVLVAIPLLAGMLGGGGAAGLAVGGAGAGLLWLRLRRAPGRKGGAPGGKGGASGGGGTRWKDAGWSASLPTRSRRRAVTTVMVAVVLFTAWLATGPSPGVGQ